MTIYTIYLITNLINGKKYVGQTKRSPHARFVEHKRNNNNKCLISSAIRKYGKENFSFEVIYQTLDVDHIDFLEQHFVKKYNSFVCSTGWGYNLQTGGCANKTFSIESRRKMSEWQIGRALSESHKQNIKINRADTSGVNNPNYGKINSLEYKTRMSESCRGRIISIETRQKISDALKGKPKHKISCPHCGKDGDSGNMKRWHFDNCKLQLPVEDHHDI